MFVKILEKKLNLYIAWTDHDLESYKKSKKMSLKDK
jgi:DNA-directed RNA polymerase delta subunit